MYYPHRKIMLFVILFCTTKSFSQTTGPSQPEVQSFQPVSVTNMVDKSTGQFQYSIPLFTIGGYPINVNYNSQVGIENEASMVGLGFNLNCGAITRTVRGLPDDFNGDVVTKRVDMKPNKTWGIDLGLALEFVGFDKEKAKELKSQYGFNLTSTTGLFYNNYNGWGIESSFGAGFHGNISGLDANAGIGVTSNSQHGTDINPYVGLSWSYKKKESETEGIKKEQTNKYSLKGTRITPQYPGMGAGLSFNSQSFSPKIDLPFTTYSMDFSVKLGYAGAFTEIGGNVKGYFSKQELQTNTIQCPAFGFMYADRGKYNEAALMDFNREKDGTVTEETQNLALPYATQDVYNVAGQGIGGSYELKRNNIFIGFDPKTQTNSHSGGIEIEFGAGTGAHIGADIRYGYTLNTAQKWHAGNNEVLNQLDFMPVKVNNDAAAEEIFFKNPADVMFNSYPVYDVTTDIPLAPKLKNVPFFGGKTIGNTLNLDGNNITIPSSNYVTKTRQNRLDAIYYLTAGEASQYGIEKTINNYPLGIFNANPIQLNRVDQYRKANHLSEMICLKADGSKYVFNVPAYNNNMQDVSWSLNDADDITDYETSALPDVTNLKNTGKGKDDYISVTQTPAYAHSFLLGAVLSANYIDVDDNGPSTNDIGDYVKFNYSRVYQNYYWRSNNKLDKAAASKGNLADKKDGKGFYQEGTKEVWYVHSIESKNEVARFYYSARNDAFDLKNTSQTLQRLDSIYVYTRPALQSLNPVPFKRIYFDYEPINTLCKGVNGNANVGKLTLHKVYFKDGTSNKGKYSAYTFGYTNNANFNYNPLEIDRWGNYKPNMQPNTGLSLDNKEFPYVNQFVGATNSQYASAWLLNTIQLPSGGSIKIGYEAHDYAYVQHKRAMFMTKVMGFTNAVVNGQIANPLGNELYASTGGSSGPRISNNFLIFKLNESVVGTMSPSTADAIIRSNFFKDNNDNEYGNIIDNGTASYHANLYGKFRVQLNGDYGYEDIPAFMGVRSCGAVKFSGETDYNYGFAELEPVAIEKSGAPVANPVFKAAGQFIKLNYTNILFGFDDDPGLSGNEKAKAIASVLNPAAQMLNTFMQTSPYKKLLKEDLAKTINPNASFVRVYEPTGFKIGGNGARVKEITINDNWGIMTGNQSSDANYTIQYKYTQKMGNKTISSGVAAYEPETGGDENPFKQPVFFTTKNVIMPNDNNYLVTPFGESLFPSPGIVYSEVKTIQNPINSTNQIGSGYAIDKFYTYFDFPCKTSNTNIELVHKPKLSFSLLKNLSQTYLVAAQGYSVVTNDMQGKQKSEETFGEGGNLITGKYYNYKTSGGALDNRVRSITLGGVIKNNQLLGVETQLYGDARSFLTETFSGDVHGNLDITTPPPPAALPSIWPDFSYEKKSFNSSVLCKYVRLQGILESVKVVDKGSAITTKNELWDDKTGAVLLTQTINEFKDPIFNFTYPAHWAYTGMGMASDNIGASVVPTMPSYQAALALVAQPGDIIAANGYKYVIQTISGSSITTSPLYSTTPILTLVTTPIKIIASGKKNLATTAVGHITSLINPIISGTLNITPTTNVIDANAIEFTNMEALNCDSCNRIKGPNNQFTNYLLDKYSLKKITPWQQLAAYKFVGDRNQNTANPIIRQDGYINSFNRFWIPPATPSSNWTKTNNIQWQFTNRLSYIDKKTNPLESFNPLRVFSAVQPSNIDGQTYAVTNNARYFENLFESFEEQQDNCNTNHFQVSILNTPMLDNTTALLYIQPVKRCADCCKDVNLPK